MDAHDRKGERGEREASLRVSSHCDSPFPSPPARQDAVHKCIQLVCFQGNPEIKTYDNLWVPAMQFSLITDCDARPPNRFLIYIFVYQEQVTELQRMCTLQLLASVH